MIYEHNLTDLQNNYLDALEDWLCSDDSCNPALALDQSLPDPCELDENYSDPWDYISDTNLSEEELYGEYRAEPYISSEWL